MVVAEDGRLFSFGDNSLAQLGRCVPDQAAERSAEDWLVKDADGAPLLVTSVAAGLSHCMAVAKGGEVPAHGSSCRSHQQHYWCQIMLTVPCTAGGHLGLEPWAGPVSTDAAAACSCAWHPSRPGSQDRCSQGAQPGCRRRCTAQLWERPERAPGHWHITECCCSRNCARP